ncbi:hypothetical protein DQ04_04441030 [Trypanosoma grayi]|uniref:hypothetical protein n=1 Tax=Trypanosoma grayi TaxID=71804 RepID=UPI0004F428E3|nr:hypothetical protein DQ04_04441030 [Trypanosoma grayi]KEG09921.1 hypothetical protein DQ04_04441030 [Trypanosoma grayi]
MPMVALGDEEEEQRVFVNNQNTRTATVTIPTSPMRRSQVRAKGGAYAELKRGAQRANTGDGCNVKVATKSSIKGSGGIRRSEVHPQLEDVYQRVMRRLQAQANYEEIGLPSLAVQFGIVDASPDERSRDRNEWDMEDNRTSERSASSGATVARGGSAKRRGPQLPRVVHSTKAEHDDDTLFLSQQPCPKTLRLVLEQVTATVAEKLRIADTGSLKNCLRFVFESRTLLDRLLKEIPTYSHFQGEGERLPTAMQLQELYQEFRRQPVVLPSATYARDTANGRVVACVGDERNGPPNAAELAGGAEGSQPPLPLPAVLQQQQQQVPKAQVSIQGASGQAQGPFAPLETTSRFGIPEPPKSVALPGGIAVPIPATYAKSTRSRQGGGGKPHQAGSSVATSFHVSPASTEASFRSRADGRGPSHDKIAETARLDDAASMGGGAASLQATHRAASERCCRATQEVAVGVLTEINNATVVSRDEHNALRAYAEKLEVEIEERKQEARELVEQLEEERAYTSQKRKVVQYLRQTLYKECSVLRSQLSAAQQKQIQYQSVIKEQQQTLSHAAYADARSGASVSAYESPRYPNSSVMRPNTYESSVTMMSLTPGLHSHRRMNPNASVFGFTRNSLHAEEHEDGNTSTVGGGAGNGAATPIQRVSVDISAINSLLDLVLLAVENDQMLPNNVSKAKNANMTIIASAMTDDPHARQLKMKNEFEERQRQMKQSYTLSRVQTSNLLAVKDQQIECLKSSSEIQFLSEYWKEKAGVLRQELRRIRNAVQEELNNLKLFVLKTMSSIANHARVVDTTLRDNHSLHNTQSTLRDIISSARTLVVPMLTTEYARGYHPWPIKLRNTMDPFAHMVQARYGEGQLLAVREEMNALSDIYVAVHQYVMRSQATPQLKRPMPGRTLQRLCALLALNRATTSDVWLQIREKYTQERELQRRIAELNMSVVMLIFRQRIMTERSADAMQEAGMDPRLIGLPAQRTINMIAEQLHKVVAERAVLRKQRQDNARDVYRIWKSKQIDIYENYPPPTVPPRLVLGESDAVREGAVMMTQFGNVRKSSESLRRSISLQGRGNAFWERMLSTSDEGRNLVELHESPPNTTLTVSETSTDTVVGP